MNLKELIKTITFTGKSGKKYEFEMYELDKNIESLGDLCSEFPEDGGVYIFTKRHKYTDRYTHDLIYCGETNDLSDRFYGHHKEDCIKKNNANCICIRIMNAEKERISTEKDILKGNNFKCNDLLN